MYDIFGKYGAIRQIRLGSSNTTRGTAYVVYEDIFDAKNACDNLNGFQVAGRYLIVSCLLVIFLFPLALAVPALPPSHRSVNSYSNSTTLAVPSHHYRLIGALPPAAQNCKEVRRYLLLTSHPHRLGKNPPRYWLRRPNIVDKAHNAIAYMYPSVYQQLQRLWQRLLLLFEHPRRQGLRVV